MTEFGPAAIVGLCVGFLWGIGCSLAILYSIYLGGYRKAVEDSLAPQKTRRFIEALRRIHVRRDQDAVKRNQDAARHADGTTPVP
jgi:hypothetical protein